MGTEFNFTPSSSPVSPDPYGIERPKIPANLDQLDKEILNAGLSLSLEFGPNWLKPIQQRLKAQFPTLGLDQLNVYDSACRGVRDHCQEDAYRFLEKVGVKEAKVEDWKRGVRSTYSWISEANLNHLYSQSCYYAMKDGLR